MDVYNSKHFAKGGPAQLVLAGLGFGWGQLQMADQEGLGWGHCSVWSPLLQQAGLGSFSMAGAGFLDSR